jgi:chromosomal replication initiator protein
MYESTISGIKLQMTIQEQDDVRLSKSAKEVWSEALQILSKKLTKPTFESWIKPAQLMRVSNGEAVIGVTNDFAVTFLSGSHRETLASAISEVLNEKISVRIVFDQTIKSDSYASSIANITVVPSPPEGNRHPSQRNNAPSGAQPITSQNNKGNLSPKYTFDTFVVGSHNRFVHSAALAVAGKPAQSYNPLFLYGGVGLGKTHIMHAIGHEVLKHSPHLNVRYLSCEKFTNELINSIRDDRMVEFRKRFRQVDVLLVDDIQFIQGKDATQEEFFHTFNTLRDNGGQIVLSSDRAPKAISLLEERLRSRFEWGLTADIQAPDHETRIAILRKKCELDGITAQDDVLDYIAGVFATNIRELEGALIRSHAYASMTGTELTPSVLRGILQPSGPEKKKKTLTMDQIIDTVSAQYRVESSDLRSARRSHDLALPRHVAMYLAHEIMQMSFPRIGQAFGRKHTSALYAHSRVRDQMPTDPDLAHAVKLLTRQLND